MLNLNVKIAAIALLAILIVVACSRQAADFEHAVAGPATPWNHTNFDAADDKFTFAIFSDLTGGEREGIFEVAVAQLSILRPEFIIGVGDLIEGGTTDRQQLSKEWESFDARADKARAPVFHVGGNHDLTNMVMRDFWLERFGARYYHFVYKKVLFLILDTEDNTPERMQEIYLSRAESIRVTDAEGWGAFSTTEYAQMPEQKSGNIGIEQSDYFQKVIASNPDVRWTFLFMHKAAWTRDGEQNFAAIEKSLSERPYTLFHGHIHAYEYEKRHGRDYIRLGTTGGVQFVEKELSIDHVTLVTVAADQVDIANLRMSGIFDRTGRIPLRGEELCFSAAECSSPD